MKITDPTTGKEIEVFTAEDLNKKIEDAKSEHNKSMQEALEKAKTEAIDEFKKNNPDKSAEVEKLQKDLKTAQDALDSAGEGDSEQVKRLRRERDEAQEALKTQIGDLTKQFGEIRNTIVGNVKEDLLKKFAGDDKDKRAKIERFYDDFKGEAVTKEQITERMAHAVTLATGTQPAPGFMDGASGAGARGDGNSAPKPGSEPTENELALGKQLGITPEIRAKYSPKTTN